MLTEEQRKKKQRLVRVVIVFCLFLIPALAYMQRGLLSGDFNLPISSTILIFALININGLLLLLMLYLVLRNLVELVFERRQKVLGARLRTRLVICFVSLSLIPTAILFIVALRFVSTSMDYWFNAKVEKSLQSSLKLTQSILDDSTKQAEYAGRQLASILESGTLD
jgi:two-component system, NtrC family, nitrogen regulation sensor histidine kinase NtrY